MIMRHASVAAISSVIIVNAFLYLLYRDQTFVHIDAIAHVNKARGLFDNIEPGLRQLGTVWLPLPHILAAPLAAIDPLWRSGAAGSLLSVVCFVGSSLFLFLIGIEWTGSPIAGWLAFLFFAFNPHLIYLFNLVYFEDPLTFAYGIGSAQAYASQTKYLTAGSWADSAVLYFMDSAYCLNPVLVWIGLGGIIVSLLFSRRDYWRPTIVLLAGCLTIFLFYTFNLYFNIVPITMPGMLKNDPQSVMNVRYGAVMAATIPVFAALHRYRKQTASGHAPSAGPHPHQQPDRPCCCMDNWNSNALFRDRGEQRQMGIQSAKDRTRYSMGNHRRRRSTVECSREVSGRALRRNSNREDGCNQACASVPEPDNGKIATKRHKRSQQLFVSFVHFCG